MHYNWSTDESELKNNPERYEIWKLEQMCNYGLRGEKLSEKTLRKYFDRLTLDTDRRSLLYLWLYGSLPAHWSSDRTPKKIGKNDWLRENFYLGEGTALSAFHLHHRYSEDLDFFSEKQFDVMPVTVFFESIRNNIAYSSIDFEQSFNRNLFFLHFPDEVLKLEFTYYPFRQIEQGTTEHRIRIDSLIDIAVNKLFTIYQQSRARDYIDLYCICKDKSMTIADLIPKARIKFDWHIDPIQLGSQFLKARGAKDVPRMIKKVDPEAWQKFFIGEAEKLKGEVMQ
jgi:hypothetical protein